MEFREYWKSAHQRAVNEASRSLGLDTRPQLVIKTIIIVGALLALLLYGSSDASRDEMIVRVVIAVGLAVFFPFFYLWELAKAPVQINQEQAHVSRSLESRISELEASADPRLAFEWEPLDARWYIQKHDGMDLYVSVRNLSTSTTIDDVRVIVERFDLGSDVSSQTQERRLPLQFSSGLSTDIPPTGIAHFRVASVVQPDMVHTAPEVVVIAPREGGNDAKWQPGKFDIHVRAEGRDLQPVRAIYVLAVTQVSTSLSLKLPDGSVGKGTVGIIPPSA